FDFIDVQLSRDYHLVALAGEEEKSHFRHHHELLRLFAAQLDYQGDEIPFKPRKQNGRTYTEVRDLSHQQPLDLVLKTGILYGFVPEPLGFRSRPQPFAVEIGVSPRRPLNEDARFTFVDRIF